MFHNSSILVLHIPFLRVRTVTDLRSYSDAEAAERNADRALVAARASVKNAREHVRVIEREAAEEARLAKIKQEQVAEVGRRAAPLGRHGIFK